MFTLLDLDQISDSQKEQLFAFCDVDCSGEISEKEFEEGWEKMRSGVEWLCEGWYFDMTQPVLPICLAFGKEKLQI